MSAYLTARLKTDRYLLTPGALYLTDSNLCVRHPDISCITVELDHTPGTKEEYIPTVYTQLRTGHLLLRQDKPWATGAIQVPHLPLPTL